MFHIVMMEFLYSSGSPETFSLKTTSAVISGKEAYAAGVIASPEVWDDIIKARNVTSHVYDEKTSISVADQIAHEFLPVLQKLDEFYLR